MGYYNCFGEWIHNLNSHFPLAIRFRTWLMSSHPLLLHDFTGNSKICSMFARSPFSWKGRSIGNLWMHCHLHFLFLIFPVLLIAARNQIQLPFSFLPLQSLAVVAVRVAPSQLAKKSIHLTAGQNGKGEVEAGDNPSAGEMFLGKLQSALRVHLPAVRVWRLHCQGRPSLQEGGKHWGPHPQLLLCSNETLKDGPAFIRWGTEPEG